MNDVIIIGKGPAGISAALYTVRANLKTLVLGYKDSMLIKADKIENYYGFEYPVTGKEILLAGEKQALRIGAQIINEEVYRVEQAGDCFIVNTATTSYEAKAVLIATGQDWEKINIANLETYEGRGVSYCTTCDGFFYRNRTVGVVGSGDYALHEANELEPFTKDITIFTNGVAMNASDSESLAKYKIETKKIERIVGDDDAISGIVFQDGSTHKLDGLFIAGESASGVDFARKMGVAFEGNNIVADAEQKTNIPGLFAAGDVTGGFKQISTAVGQGAIAGRKIIEYIKRKK